MMHFPTYLRDTLVNLVSKLGTSADKAYHNQFGTQILDHATLTTAYRGDWVARKVVDVPADDATREWRAWQAEADQIEAIEAVEESLGVQEKLKDALVCARLYGGGALVLGVNGDDPSKELVPERVSRGGLKFVHAVSRHEIKAGELELDVTQPNFGAPMYYEVSRPQAVGVRIHASRVVRLVGQKIPDRAQSTDGWGDPILQSVYDAVMNVASSTAGVASLIQEAKVDVIKVPGMMAQLGDPDYRARLTERFSSGNQLKSIVNALLLDKEEDWERITVSFAGLPEIMKLYLLIASGAADIPATRLLGQSAVGLGATGEGDLRNYYDSIASKQKNTVSPALRVLDEVLIRSALGSRPEEIWYEWNSLWQTSPKEKAETDKIRADTYKLDVDAQLIEPEILRTARLSQLIEDGTYPGIERAIEEFEASGEGVDEDDEQVREQFGAMRGEPDGEEEPLDTVDRLTARLHAVLDEFNESAIERDKDGKFAGSGGGGDDKKGGDKNFGSAEKAASYQVKGGSPERMAMRKELKTAKGEHKVILQTKILQSFEKDHAKFTKLGKMDKVKQLEGKIQQYSKAYGIKTDVGKITTTAQANAGFSEKEVSGAKSVMASAPKPGGGAYTPQEQATFNVLVSAVGKASAADYSRVGATRLKGMGKEGVMTPAEAGMIVAYTGSAYQTLNAQMRTGSMDEHLWDMANGLNEALSKLSAREGITYRHAGQAALNKEFYKPGRIVEERAFTSTSKSSSFAEDGAVTYEIKGYTGRDVTALSKYKSENEVLFRSGTRFKVTSAESKSDGRLHVKMEEIRGR